jgi:hypothetical protein
MPRAVTHEDTGLALICVWATGDGWAVRKAAPRVFAVRVSGIKKVRPKGIEVYLCLTLAAFHKPA